MVAIPASETSPTTIPMIKPTSPPTTVSTTIIGQKNPMTTKR
jgi:hypothetical protein